MSSTFAPAETLRKNRPLLLAAETIGWFHMAGKAREEFLRRHGGEKNDYEERRWHAQETPPFPWDGLLGWVKQLYGNAIPNDAWPGTFAAFTEKHAGRNPGVLGLLQVAHGIVSGVEKNLPGSTSDYLNQSACHMWLSSPWGHPKRNLLADPPEVLTPQGWRQLVGEIQRILQELHDLGTQGVSDVALWRRWREQAIGEGSLVCRAFLSTLAETRLPNNDVTLWDQSYVAAALFKSALAGALLDSSFPWADGGIKSKVRWRLLTVALGTEHYEARAVKIGDWTGAQRAIQEFFRRVADLVEVDLAVGSMLYRDSSVAIFSFPGERFDERVPAGWLSGWRDWLQDQVEEVATELELETPPLVCLSAPTRSLVPMVNEWQGARQEVAMPIHRKWNISPRTRPGTPGHVCPVCQVRLNDDLTNKGKPCEVCLDRRHHRRDAWLQDQLSRDTIWFEEVADCNGRLAMLTFSLDLEGWLSGERLDSLRAQAISEWARFNPVLEEFWQRDESQRQRISNPIDPSDLVDRLEVEIRSRFYDSGNWRFPEKDLLLANLQEGFRHFRKINPKRQNEVTNLYEERLWKIFFEHIVEDRASAPSWSGLNDNQRAAWLAHQLFCKLPSPGRVYRFWREAEEFFNDLLREFRQIAARSGNPWRIRRLLVVPTQESNWKDGQLYNANLGGAPFSLIYLNGLKGFVTTSNLGRILKSESSMSILAKERIELMEEDLSQRHPFEVKDVKDLPRDYAHLSVYHPVIPVEVSPLRFRILVPLEAASECVDLAVSWWQERFARVWDRLPLQVGVVAFPRLVPYQAVVEATRNMEDALSAEEEVWSVKEVQRRAGVVALHLQRPDGQTALRMVPVALPDGRDDMFYPYLVVEDQRARFSHDFCHPRDGRIYRHVSDLRPGDGVRVIPARIGTLFMESTASRFEVVEPQYLEEWTHMRRIWELLQRVAPSQTALLRLHGELARLHEEWQTPDGELAASDGLWGDTLRALLAHHLEVQETALDALTEAALQGTLQWALNWHVTVLKESI